MPANITKISFFNQFRNESVDWLLANQSDKVRIEIEVTISSYVIASHEEPILVNAANGMPPGAGWVKDDSARFKDFKIGDTIFYYNRYNAGTGTFTIIDKLDDGAIQFNTAFSSTNPDSVLDNAIFSLANPITALKYKWNFIENSESANFLSKIDGTDQELVVKSISASVVTPIDMIYIGAKPYQVESASAQGVSITSTDIYTSKFKIIHYTKLTPFMLAAQWPDLLNGVNADYYQNLNCLKAIFDIKGARDYNDPNWIEQDTVSEVLGNTGGLGENFNSGLTNYKVSSVVFTDSNTNVIPSIGLTTDETTVEIHIQNTIDAPFSNNNTQFELQICKAPNKDSEYTNNLRTAEHNFLDDRAFQKVGSAVVNGDQYGVSDRQILKSVKGTYVSASEIKITAQIAMLTDVLTIFNESTEPRYILTVEVQKHTLQTKLSDLVRLPVSVSPFYISVVDDGLVEIDNTYYRHYDSALAGEGVKLNMVVAKEDEVVSYSKFFVDRENRSTDIIKIVSVEAKIKAKNAVTLEEFTLDNILVSFAGTPFIGVNQYIDFSLDRVFLIPPAEIRKTVHVKRRSDLDVGDKAYYEVYFPFLVRWEYWVSLPGANNVFFDITQPNNGQNENWYSYPLLPDWGVYYDLTVNMNKNGSPLSYNFENLLDVYDYDSNPNWDPNTIKSFDPTTLTELIDSVTGKKYLYDNQDTLIRADFTKVSGAPNLSDMVVNMHIELFESGGVENTRRMSSAWPSDANTWFKSIDLSSKTKLSLVGVGNDTLRAEVLVDGTLLSGAKYSIQSRLYEKPGPFVCVCPQGYTFDEANMNCRKDTTTKNGYIWYFGTHIKFDFNTLDISNNPVVTLDGPINTIEGCTVFAKADGTVLLSTDGVSLYDDTNTLVCNDLAGSSSSTGSGIVVVSPIDPTLFYIFTTPAFEEGTHFFCYSIYDSVAKDVVSGTKNTHIVDNAAEGLCAIHNAAGESFIITQNRISGDYVVTKLATDGTITSVNVAGGTVSTFGAGHIRYNGAGVIVHASNEKGLYMMSFDPDAGVLSNIQAIQADNGEWYGAEFSPSGTILYAGLVRYGVVPKSLFQWDISSGDLATIQASKFTVFTTVGTSYSRGFAALQLAPNGKIYVQTVYGAGHQPDPADDVTYSFVSAINNPDILGLGCSYNDSEIYISPHGNTHYGLPTFDRTAVSEVGVVPCAGACIVPSYTTEALCPGKIKITMSNRGGRAWIVTDDKGTTPITINSNMIYLFGAYTNGAVHLTLTDSRRPECKITTTINISCEA